MYTNKYKEKELHGQIDIHVVAIIRRSERKYVREYEFITII